MREPRPRSNTQQLSSSHPQPRPHFTSPDSPQVSQLLLVTAEPQALVWQLDFANQAHGIRDARAALTDIYLCFPPDAL